MTSSIREAAHQISRRLPIIAAIAIITSATPPPAAADEESPARLPWRFSGYGTVARSWDDGERVAPIRDISQRPADGHETGPSGLLDSRFGAQAALRFDSRFEAVVQAVWRDQVADSLDSKVELAYVQAQGDGIKGRIGRVGYDAFLMSDHRNLGYAYAWVRPPTEFYGWVPIYSLDGADLTAEIPAREGSWRIRGQLGNTRTKIPMGDETFDFKTDVLGSLTLSREAGPWRLKAGWSTFRIASEAGPLAPLHANLDLVSAAGLPGISAEAAMLRRETAFAKARITYLTLGAAYDDGRWSCQLELGRSTSDPGIVPQSDSGYLAIGRRFGAYTPFVVVSASRPHRSPAQPLNDWGGFNVLRDQGYFALNGTRADQRTYSTGLRWDFSRRAAAKVQWDHVRVEPDGYALWFRSLDTNPKASEINLLTLGVDFVF